MLNNNKIHFDMRKIFIGFGLLLLQACAVFGPAVKTSSENENIKQSIVAYQQGLNDKYQNPLTSPLKEEATGFKGHSFFPIDLSYRVEATFTKLEEQEFFNIETSGPKNPAYRKFGYLDFSLEGKPFRLVLLQNRDNMRNPLYRNHLFLAFTDLTSGESSYGGGRYIDMTIPTDNKMVLDFNMSYNPYCAYTTGYSCPVPPEENFLEIAVEAGIKLEQ